MKIASILENTKIEKRISITPDIAKKYIDLGFEVALSENYGAHLGFNDQSYLDLGVKVFKNENEVIDGSDIIVQLGLLSDEKNLLIKENQTLIGILNPYQNMNKINNLNKKNINIFSLELLPRITRAQSMDILSSQANLAGYKAVIESFANFEKAIPMMMTAAGTVPAAKVLVVGAGVAGLQAIATAKRMGAIVFATDVRMASKEQVESLGGKFLIVDEEAMKEAETSGGYAKEMTEEYKKKEQEVIKKHISDQDIVITTALIPGRPAPRLVTAEMVKSMRTGAVIVDLAAEMGGNCELTKRNEVFDADGVKIVGYDNLPGELPKDASTLFAKNLLNFLSSHFNSETKKLELDWEDETVKNTLVTKGGNIVSEIVKGVS